MTGVPARVAVHAGTSTVRIAATDPGGRPYLLAEAPARPRLTRIEQVSALFAELLGGPPDELVLVHPASGAGPGPSWGALADVVGAVPAGAAAGHLVGGPVRLVVDVGYAGAELTVLDRAGRPVSARRCPAGGARLDAAVAALVRSSSSADGTAPPARTDGFGEPAAARRLRETLSLMPAVPVRLPDGVEVRITADQVRARIAPMLAEVVARAEALLGECGLPGSVSVLLVGGVARTPLLAELFDRAALGPVTVAPRPDAVAVLGALRLPSVAGIPVPTVRSTGPTPTPVPVPVPTPVGVAVPVAVPVGVRVAVPETVPVAAARAWLPAPPGRRHRLIRAAAAVVLAAAATAAAALLGERLPSGAPGPADVVAQYGYAMRLPDGWAHTGGRPERRRTLLTPTAAPEGSDLVVVERTMLGYDAAAEPARAVTELLAAFDSAVATGMVLSDLDPAARYAGRTVATYRQRAAGGVIDWYVLLDGTDQLSVGCQHTVSGAEQVQRACAVVVASLQLS